MPIPRNAKPLLGWPAVIAILATCLGVFCILFPDDFRFVERLAKDKKPLEALQALHRIPAGERDRSRQRYDILSLQLQRALLESSNRHGPESLALLDEALASGQRHRWPEPFVRELTAAVTFADDPNAVFEKLKNKPLPAPAQLAVADALKNRALALNEPELAATIYSEFARRSPPTEKTTAELVGLWRMIDRPKDAIEAIRTFEGRVREQPGGLLAVSPHLYDLEIRLLREIGRNAEAFDLLRKQFRVAGDLDQAKPLLKPLTESAYACGRLKDLASEYERALALAPGDVDLLTNYADLLVDAGEMAKAQTLYARLVSLRPDDDKLRLHLAELSEWSGNPAAAFDAYMVLGRHGDAHAIDRLIDLSWGLFRLPELVEVLGEAVPVAGRPDLTLVFTRDLVQLGRYKEAQTWFKKWLEEHPDDYDVWIELGVLHRSLDQFEEAVADFTSAQRLRPNDLTAGLALAELMSNLGRFDEALQGFAAVAETHHFPHAIRDYARLAESLGDVSGEAAALQLSVDYVPDAGPEQFTRLADLYDLQDQSDRQLQTLRNGITRFPSDPELIYQTAARLGEEKLWSDALAMLGGHPGLHTEPRVIILNLRLLISADHIRAAEAFLNTIHGPALLATAQRQLGNGDFSEETGNTPAAEKIFRQLISRHEGQQPQMARASHKPLRRPIEEADAQTTNSIINQP